MPPPSLMKKSGPDQEDKSDRMVDESCFLKKLST